MKNLHANVNQNYTYTTIVHFPTFNCNFLLIILNKSNNKENMFQS